MGAKSLKAVAVDDEGTQARAGEGSPGVRQLVGTQVKNHKEGPQLFARGTSSIVGAANMMNTLPTHGARQFMQFDKAMDLDGARIIETSRRAAAACTATQPAASCECSNVVHGPTASTSLPRWSSRRWRW
ncbi:MAG: hypothetical protein U0802_02395 [Candidatus Binatia bacterium]